MLGPDGDLVVGGPHCLPLIPLLLVGVQSSLDEDVLQEDVHDDVVACVYLTVHLPAATYDVFSIQSLPGLASEAL